MKLLSIIEATKIQEGSLDSYYAYHDAARKWAEDTGKHKDKFAYAGTDVQDEYIEPEMKKRGLVPDRYMGAGVTSYKRENIEEGEERSIIQDACIEKLVDEFSGRENQFANKEDFEYAIYQALEDLDVEDCVDPDMEVGGQRIGDFASGRVIDCCSSSNIIYDVMANMDETQIGEGITTKHSYDPVKPGGQSSPRKPVPLKGQKVSLDGVDFMVTLVSDDRKTFDVVNMNDPKEVHRGIKVDSNSFFIENLDYLDKSKYKDMPMRLELQRVLAQILGIDNYYKMDVEDLEKQLKSNPANSTLWNEYSAYKKKLQIQRDDKVSPTIGNFASDNRDPRFREGKSPHKKGSAKYKKHMAAMHAEAKDPKTSDADQIIKQIIDGYGIDNLEDVFRQYYPQLSDEQVERFLSKHKKPELRLIKNEDVDLNDNMIGTPDEFYDAEERTEAYDEMQDAVNYYSKGSIERQNILDGICPNCGGNGYQDGEEEMWDDDEEEYVEGNECDGWGNYGCDQGEMTFYGDEGNWIEIIKHDRRKSERKKAKANYPGDEKVINQIRNMVMGMDDPRMAMQQMAIDYPHMGRGQRAELVAKGMKAAGLTNEGQRCWKGYEKKGTKKMFGKTVNNCVKKEGVNMNENKWKEVPQGKGKDGKKYFIALTTDNMPLDWPTYWEWEQSHGETNKNKASLRYGGYVSDAKQFLGIDEGTYDWADNPKIIDKHDKPEKKKSKKDESIQAGDELMIETADGEGIVVPVLHVVDENILVGWDELAENIVVEGARQLEELRKLAGIDEAEYQGRKVKLGKPTRGDVKKFKVYVKDPKTGNVKKVNFGHGGSSAKKAGQKTMKIKKSNPARRKSFRARHNCDNPGPRTKARYWSCRAW